MIISNHQLKLAKRLLKMKEQLSLTRKYSSTYENRNLLDLKKRGILVGIFPEKL
jgi:hypothetical protein